jgi:hypothetical protein
VCACNIIVEARTMFAPRCLLGRAEMLGGWWLRERPSKDLEA